jgi:hypothetical protein
MYYLYSYANILRGDIMSELKDDVISAAESYENCISFNMKTALALILFEEHHGNKFAPYTVNDLVNTILETSRWKGPEGEEYPGFDDKKVMPIIEKIRMGIGKPAKTPW